jgi:hypothetical protein
MFVVATKAYVWKILDLEVIFVEGNWYHGPSWLVERHPWQNGVHSPFIVSFGPIVFMLLV